MRGGGGVFRWVLLGAAVVAGAAYAVFRWAWSEPFKSAFPALRAAAPRDPDVLYLDGEYAAAARVSRDPRFAMAWLAHALSGEDDPPSAPNPEVDDALARWRALEPENPLPDLVAAARMAWRDRASAVTAAAQIDAALARPGARPRLGGELGPEVSIRVQRRLGVRDVPALLMADGTAQAWSEVRRAAYVILALAERAAWLGQVDEALARAAALRRLGADIRAGSPEITGLVALAIEGMGTELELRLAVHAGDPARAREAMARQAERRLIQAEVKAGLERSPLFDDAILGALAPQELDRDLPRRTLARLRLRLRTSEIFAHYATPGGTFAAARALGAGARPDPTDTESQDAFQAALLRDAAAFGPPAPEGSPPEALVRWLDPAVRRKDVGDEVLAEAARALARWGPRARPALEAALPAIDAEGEEVASRLLPALVAAGHPQALARTRAALERAFSVDVDGAEAVVAAEMLRDRSLRDALLKLRDAEMSKATDAVLTGLALRACGGD